jgi:hypothetical protein
MQPGKAPSCTDRQILRARLRADLRVYVDAVAWLDQATGKDFEKAFKHAEEARRAFLAAREKVNRHITSHGCL